MVSASRRAGANAASWLCSATSVGADLREPSVDADHGDAGVVLVEPLPPTPSSPRSIACEDTPLARTPRVEAGVHEAMVPSDDVCLARVAEPGALQHDPVDPLRVEVGRDDADPRAVAVEQGRGDRDRRLAGQPRRRDRLHRGLRAPRRKYASVDCGRDSCAGTVDSRHPAVEVEHEELLRVGRLVDAVLQHAATRRARLRPAAPPRPPPAPLGGPARARRGAGLVAPEQAAREHDVALLLVDPAVERIRLTVRPPCRAGRTPTP